MAERQPHLVKNRAQYIADHERKQAAEVAKPKRVPYSPSDTNTKVPPEKFASNLAKFEAEFGMGMGSSHAGVVDAPGRLQSGITPPQEAREHQRVVQVPLQHNNTPHGRPKSGGGAARPDTMRVTAESGASSGSGTHTSTESPPGDTEHENSSQRMTRSQARTQAAIPELAVASSARAANNPSRENTGGNSKERGPRRSAGNKASRRPPSDVQTTVPQGHGHLNQHTTTSIGEHSRLKQGLPPTRSGT